MILNLLIRNQLLNRKRKKIDFIHFTSMLIDFHIFILYCFFFLERIRILLMKIKKTRKRRNQRKKRNKRNRKKLLHNRLQQNHCMNIWLFEIIVYLFYIIIFIILYLFYFCSICVFYFILFYFLFIL
jgi:hypothetical protein